MKTGPVSLRLAVAGNLTALPVAMYYYNSSSGYMSRACSMRVTPTYWGTSTHSSWNFSPHVLVITIAASSKDAVDASAMTSWREKGKYATFWSERPSAPSLCIRPPSSSLAHLHKATL